MRKLILMIGPPASGKSTFVEEHFDDSATYIVSYDEIKKSLFGEEGLYREIGEEFNFNCHKASLNNKSLMRKAVSRVQSEAKIFPGDIVIDAMNLTDADRRKEIETYRNVVDEIEAIYCTADARICISRNNDRTGSEYVPLWVLLSSHDELVSPMYSEGFDKIWLYDEGTFKLKKPEIAID